MYLTLEAAGFCRYTIRAIISGIKIMAENRRR
jgi:hypothetical protein